MKKVASFTETLATLQEGDKDGLIDLIVKQAAARKMKVSKGTINKMQNAQFDFLYDVARAQLMGIAFDIIPDSVLKKISTYQTMSHLLNLKTALRNVVSNQSFDIVESAVNDLAIIPDAIMSIFTGQRSVGIQKSWFSEAKRKGAVEGARKSSIEADLDVTTGKQSKYQTTTRRSFKESGNIVDKILSKAEKVMAYELNVTDEMHKGSVEAEVLESLMPFVDNGTITLEEAKAEARYEALYRSFQDDTWAGRKLGGVKKFFNGGLEFGAGDFICKYTQVPGALITRAVEYSPMGYAKFIFELARAHNAGGLKANPLIQRRAALAMSRATTGTGLIAVFASLALKGLLKNQEDEKDKNLAALQSSEGISGTQLNLSALGRWISGGNTDWQSGDTLVKLDFLEPFNSLMAMGTAIANSEGKSIGDMALTTLDSVGKAVADLPTMQSLKTIMTNFNNDDGFFKNLLNTTVDIASSNISGFIPGLIRQTAQALDPYYRTATNPVENIQKSIPGLRNLLPATQTPYGEDKQYGNGALNAVNALVSPGEISSYRPHLTTQPLTELYKASADEDKSKLLPDRKAQYSTFSNQGETVEMTEAEQRRYKTLYGNKLQDLQESILNSSKSDDKKVEELLKAQAEAKEYARRTIVEARGEMYLTTAQLATFKKYTAAGIKDKSAYELYKSLQKLEPEIGRKSVTDIQRYRAINNASYLTDKEKLGAVSVISDSAYKKASALAESGLKFDDIYAVMKQYNDLYNNDSLNASDKTLKFRQWLYSQNYKPSQFKTIRDNYVFFNMFPADKRSSRYKIPSIYD